MKRAWQGLGGMGGDKISNRRTSQERRDQIATAAVRCLTEYGYAGLTARKVAQSAEISLGHLTYHYETMDSVLVAAFETVAAQMAPPVITATIGLTPAERLVEGLHAVYAPVYLTPEALRLRVDLWSAAQMHPAIAAIERRLHEQMRAQISLHLNAISDPWKTTRIPMVESFVMTTMDGLWLDYLRHQDLDAVHAAIEALVLFVRMRLGGT